MSAHLGHVLHAVINNPIITITVESSAAATGKPTEPSPQPRLGWGCLVLGGGPEPNLLKCGKIGTDPCMRGRCSVRSCREINFLRWTGGLSVSMTSLLPESARHTKVEEQVLGSPEPCEVQPPQVRAETNRANNRNFGNREALKAYDPQI